MSETTTKLIHGGIYKRKGGNLLAFCISCPTAEDKEKLRLMWLTGAVGSGNGPQAASWCNTEEYEYLGMIDWKDIEKKLTHFYAGLSR